MSGLDENIRESLNSKFEYFEAAVDETLWKEVAMKIGNPGGHGRKSRRLWVLLLLITLSSSIIGYYNFYQGTTEKNVPTQQAENSGLNKKTETKPTITEVEKNQSNVRNSKAMVTQDDTTSSGIEPSNIVQNKSSKETQTVQTTMVQEEEKGLDHLPNNDSPTHQKIDLIEKVEVDKMQRTDFESMNIERLKPIRVLMDDSTVNVGFDESRLREGMGELPGLISLEHLTQLTDLDRTQPREGLTVKRRKNNKFLTRLNLGITMNYHIARPNDQDNALVEDNSDPFDLSSNRLGFRAGYDVWLHMKSRIWFKGAVYGHIRQHEVNFSYAPNANPNGENNFQPIKEIEGVTSLGFSAGLLYQIDNDDVRRRSLDIGFGYEQVVLNGFKNNSFVTFPQGHWSVNLGLTFAPSRRRSNKWLVRPFGFYGLNRKSENATVSITPYGFGIQLIRN